MLISFNSIKMYNKRKRSYRGDYNTSKNSLMSSSSRSSVASRFTDSSEDLLISHTEYMYDIYAPNSADFKNETINLNPGLSQQFTYLAQFA